MVCQSCRHEFCWLCMGGTDTHETPRGWPHAKQCDSIEDVKKKGRLDFMWDESKAVAKMEQELKHLEGHSKKYKYHREMNKKHTRQLTQLKQKIQGIINATVDYSWDEFQFLVDTVEVCMQARTALMYSCAFRFYLIGANRQAYFDRIIDELETALDHLMALSQPNWFFYMQYVDGIPVLRENFVAYKQRLEDTSETFITLFNEFMPSVKDGMPELPPSDVVPTENEEKVEPDEERKVEE